VLSREELLLYRCPRWNDWPDLGLYMDQVVSLIEKQVAGFYPEDASKPVTSTMINNYVKQKIVSPSQKKKYERSHLAQLYILFLLKPALSLPDICGVLGDLMADRPIEEFYDGFCDLVEASLAEAFTGAVIRSDRAAEMATVCALLRAYAHTQFARLMMQDASALRQSQEDSEPRQAKPERSRKKGNPE